MTSYTIVDVPGRWVVGTREKVATNNMEAFFDRVIGDAADRIEAVGGSIQGAAVAYYYTPVTDTADVLCGFPVIAEVAAKTTSAVQFPMTRAARFVHQGSYDGLGEAWKTFIEDIVSDGYSIPQQPCWEEYVVEPTPQTPPAELVTELYCPIM